MASQEYIAAAFMTLGCNPSSSEEHVKNAYLELAKIWHPDRFEVESALKSRATQKMQLLTDAYNRLTQMFDERRKLMELQAKITTSPLKSESDVSPPNTLVEVADFSIGSECTSTSMERDPTTGKVTYHKKVEIITSYDGRWLTKAIKTFSTIPSPTQDTYESASSRAMSFRLNPVPSAGIGEYARVDYESALTAAQNASDPNYAGDQNETLGGSVFCFVDGSEFEEATVKTDTWFQDDDKKVKHLQNSNELLDLRGVFRILNKRGEGAACVSVARRIVELFPQEPNHWLLQANCLHRWRTSETALESLRPAAKRFPNEINIHIDLARYAAMSGKTLEARQWLVTVFAIAESWGHIISGPNTGFNRIRNLIANDPDLIALRDAIPNEPNSWKFKRFFGL
jgi:hypothetical protein